MDCDVRELGSWLRMLTPCLLAAAAAMSGCGSHGTAPDATQVVAKVNGHELTVLQLNHALVQANAPSTGAAETQKALKQLIDEELLVQAALSAKLDRDPDVAMRIAATQREILARAYAEERVYPHDVIDESELKKFYDDNPALFSARRIYHALAFVTDKQQLPDTLLAQIGTIHGADGLGALLTQYEVHFELNVVTRAAESIPLESLSRFAAAGPGDVVPVIGGGAPVQLLMLQSVDPSPVSFDQAKGLIEHFLRGKRDQKALQVYLKQIQSGAKIEYVQNNGMRTPSDR
jgi:EpsD family peptidyl-prolyl cis-trans isomerase